jgi:hypothetical protein
MILRTVDVETAMRYIDSVRGLGLQQPISVVENLEFVFIPPCTECVWEERSWVRDVLFTPRVESYCNTQLLFQYRFPIANPV